MSGSAGFGSQFAHIMGGRSTILKLCGSLDMTQLTTENQEAEALDPDNALIFALKKMEEANV